MIIEYLRNLIGQGRVDTVLKELYDFGKNLNESTFNDITLLLSRFNHLERNERLGLISSQESGLERSRITHAALELSNDIEREVSEIRIKNASFLVYENRFTKSISLDLQNCGLDTLPRDLLELIWLEELNLSNENLAFNEEDKIYKNNIRALPHNFGDLINLKKLYISGSFSNVYELSDIEPIRGLKNLEELNLSYTQINDLSALEGLENLKILNISHTNVTDISHLNNLSGLEKLIISSNEITNLEVLKNFKNLSILDISDTPVFDIKPITSLASLVDISFSGTKVTDLNSVSELNKLETLKAFNTEISDIDPLKNLLNLKTLNLSNTKVYDLKPLENLKNLESLMLSHTLIQSLFPLSKCKKLEMLDLNNTRINNLKPIATLKNLKYLHIQEMPIEDISVLTKFKNLSVLDFQALRITNDVSTIEKIIDNNPDLSALRFDKNLLGIPDGFESNLKGLKKYFEQLKEYTEQEKVAENLSLKVIVLGNTRAGKSQLIDYFSSERYDDKSESTHGIRIKRTEKKLGNDNYNITFFDFGGQDFYHATHNLFLDNKSLYLTIWHPNSVQNANESYQHMPLGYWLGNIDYFASSRKDKGMTIWSVQSRADDNGYGEQQDRINIPLEMVKLYNVDPRGQYFLSVKKAFEKDPYWQFEWDYFYTHFEREVKNLTQRSFLTKDMVYVIKKVLPKIKEENLLIVTEEEFKDYCVQNPASDNYPTLVYLKAIGQILWFNHIPKLEKYIFPNPEAISEMIFSVLENKRMAINNGSFTLNDLNSTLKTQKSKNKILLKKVFIDLLEAYQIVFKKPNTDDTYVVPQYLPVQSLAKHLKDIMPISLVIRYLHYMPFWRFSNFIALKGAKAEYKAEYWRYGMIYIEKNCNIMIVMERPTFEELDKIQHISIHISGNAKDRMEVLKEIFVFFGCVYQFEDQNNGLTGNEASRFPPTPDYKQVQAPYIKKTYLSVDNFNFFSTEELVNSLGKGKNQYAATESGKIELIPSIFYPLLNLTSSAPKRIFFSYAHLDYQYRSELEVHLATLKRSGLVETWYDMEIKAGENWDKKILDEIEKADIVLGLISPDFMNSSYIWEKEIPKINADPNKKFIPIFLRPCAFEGTQIEGIQGIPFDNTKIRWVVGESWKYRDEAYLVIINQLKKLL